MRQGVEFEGKKTKTRKGLSGSTSPIDTGKWQPKEKNTVDAAWFLLVRNN